MDNGNTILDLHANTLQDNTMADKRWKAIEREVASYWGATRRGADYGDKDGGKNDVKVDGWSIEIKHGKRIGLALIKNAIKQARAASEPFDIIVAVIHQHGDPIGKSIVCMDLDDFKEWFI